MVDNYERKIPNLKQSGGKGHKKGDDHRQSVKARVEFIDKRLPDFTDEEIATALKSAGLYSPRTNHGDIVTTIFNYRKFLKNTQPVRRPLGT